MEEASIRRSRTTIPKIGQRPKWAYSVLVAKSAKLGEEWRGVREWPSWGLLRRKDIGGEKELRRRKTNSFS